MTKEEKIEMLRRRLAQQADFDSISDAMAMEVVIVCREFGWTVEYVMNMEVWKFRQVSRQLAKIYEEMNRHAGGRIHYIGR